MTLFHEMTHADDLANGRFPPKVVNGKPNVVPNGDKPGCTCPACEARAAGLPPYDKPEFQPNENDYRKERHGQDPNVAYPRSHY